MNIDYNFCYFLTNEFLPMASQKYPKIDEHSLGLVIIFDVLAARRHPSPKVFHLIPLGIVFASLMGVCHPHYWVC